MDWVIGMTRELHARRGLTTPDGYSLMKAMAAIHKGRRIANTDNAIDERECNSSFWIAEAVIHASKAHTASPSIVYSALRSNSDGTKRRPCSGIVSFPNVRMKYVPGVEIQFSKKISLADSFHTNHP